MKKKRTRKLSLSKETLIDLTPDRLAEAVVGATDEDLEPVDSCEGCLSVRICSNKHTCASCAELM